MGVINFNGFATDPLGRNYTASRNLGDDWGFGTISQRLVNWNEALHMLCPSLAAMSRVTGDRRYLAEALHLIRHCARYHVGENGLLFHASREGRPITGRWGRGHTHALYGALYTLEEMDPQDPERETILDFLRRVGCGLRGFQDQRTGLWRNDVDVPQARLESSCTCGIVAVYGRCIRESWLARDEFLDMVLKGWDGLKRMYWRGGLCAQCRGTGVGPDSYYLARPHGWQVVPQMVMAGVEIGRLREA